MPSKSETLLSGDRTWNNNRGEGGYWRPNPRFSQSEGYEGDGDDDDDGYGVGIDDGRDGDDDEGGRIEQWRQALSLPEGKTETSDTKLRFCEAKREK